MRNFLILIFVLINFVNVRGQGITWAEDVAPILYNKCTSCHHPGGIGPFSLLGYSDAYNNRLQIQWATENRVMPPWPPDVEYSHLANTKTLTQPEIDKIRQWVETGGEEGDPLHAPEVPVYSSANELINPDFTGEAGEYVVNAESSDYYRCYVIPVNNTETQYIEEVEFVPGNRPIVHHALIFQVTGAGVNEVLALDAADTEVGYESFGGTGASNSELLFGWVPGSRAMRFPEGISLKLEPNSLIVVQIHYPAGVVNKTDSSKLLYNYSTVPQRDLTIAAMLSHGQTLVNGPLVIQANEKKKFLSQRALTVPVDFTLLSVAPHMHLIGKSIKSYAVTPAQDTIPFVNIPRWDFRWQGFYNFSRAIRLPKGSTLYAEAEYDNTSDNPLNPNYPPQTVSAGEETTDEMMLVYFGFLPYQPGDELIVLGDYEDVITAAPDEQLVKTVQFYDPFPNAANTEIHLPYFLPTPQPVNVSIIALDGRQMLSEIFNAESGYQLKTMDVTNIPSGIYVVSVKASTVIRSKKVIVEH